MNIFRPIVIVLVAWLAGTLPTQAATHRVDDSASQVLSSHVRMKWDSVAPQRGARPTVTGEVAVLARLALAPWAGRHGRIYLTLPVQAVGPVTVSWTTQGRLMPGVLRAGGRTLVYAGPIAGGLLEDTLNLTIQADGGELSRPEQLHFAFEIDLESP